MGKQSWKAGNMLNPVPAVMVSVADQNHRPNIITVAWAGTVCTNPPMVSISVRPSRYSYEIIEKTGEFVINLTNEKLAKACDYCGVVSGRDVDKFKKTGLTPVPVEHVKAPAIAESPVNIACRVVESHPLGSHTMFVAEVLGVTVDDAYLDETGKFDINGTGLIMYSHGEYFALGKKLGKFGYSVQKKKKMTRGLLQQRVHQYSIYIFTFLFPVIADGFCLFFCSYAKRQVDQRIAVRPYLTAYCVFLIGCLIVICQNGIFLSEF